MVNHPTHLDTIFAALADPIRRRILEGLMSGNAAVGALAQPFRVSAPAVSRHLRVLEGAGLIHRTKRGRVHEIALATQPLQAASNWLDTYRWHWESSLDSLAAYLESEPAPSPHNNPETKNQTHQTP